MIQQACNQFEPTPDTSSATVCKWCGQEKFLHTQLTSMAQQTAVEWFAEITAKLGYVSTDVLKQAKQMEKEQMKQAVMRSVTTWHPLRKLFEKQFEEYYQETYQTKEP